MTMTDSIVVAFARLWGIKEASCSTIQEAKVSELLQTYDSDECLTVLREWANDYLYSSESDTVTFFDEKIDALVAKECGTTEQNML